MADLLLPESVEVALPVFEPEKYYAVWQHPEGRYAYMIGLRRDGWLIAMDSKEAGQTCLEDDARQNGRPPSAYRLDELTLPDAFAAARAQRVPFRTSYGSTVRVVLGVEIRSGGYHEWTGVRRIPL